MTITEDGDFKSYLEIFLVISQIFLEHPVTNFAIFEIFRAYMLILLQDCLVLDIIDLVMS